MANCKVMLKVTPFCKITPANVGLSHSSRQADSSSVPHHHKANRRQYYVLKGSAQLTMGDISGDAEAQDQFPLKSVSPEREGTPSSLSKKSGHQKTQGATSKVDRGSKNEITLHSELFVVPEAQNFIRELKASNFAQSAWCTELCISAWGTLGLKCHLD